MSDVGTEVGHIEAIFIDDGGVLNDNALRGQQWPGLVAEFFAPRLGGWPKAWAEANVNDPTYGAQAKAYLEKNGG